MASAIIELQARTKKLEAGLRRVRNQSVKTGKSLDRTAASGTKLAGVGRLIGTAFAGVGFALLARSLINIGKEFEILTARLATFEGSSAAAGAALERLNKIAQTTPFQLQDVINSFIQLRSAGLAPTNRELVALGNVAAAFGQTMNQVANVVFRGASSTELFYNLGITARKEGDKLRVTYDGVTKTIEATNKGIQEYLVSLGETRFAGAALEQAKGLTAAFSNFSGNLQFTIDKLGNASGAFQRISTILNIFSEEIIALGEQADKLFGKFDALAFEFVIRDLVLSAKIGFNKLAKVFEGAGDLIGATILGKLLLGRAGAITALTFAVTSLVDLDDLNKFKNEFPVLFKVLTGVAVGGIIGGKRGARFGLTYAIAATVTGSEEFRSFLKDTVGIKDENIELTATITNFVVAGGATLAADLLFDTVPTVANTTALGFNTAALNRLTGSSLVGGKGGAVIPGGGKTGNAGKAATGLGRLVTVLGRVGVVGTVLGGLALLAYASSEAFTLWNKVNDSVDQRIADRAAAPEGAADVDDLIDVNDKTLATLREQLQAEVIANGNSVKANEILDEIKAVEVKGQELLKRLIEALLRSGLLDTRPGLRAKGQELGVTGAANGGYISGAGTGTSDSIPALLSNGEYVIRASQAKKYKGLLENINNGTQGFANGGYVSKYAQAFQTGGAVLSTDGQGVVTLNTEEFDKLNEALQRVVNTALETAKKNEVEIQRRRQRIQAEVDYIESLQATPELYEKNKDEIEIRNAALDREITVLESVIEANNNLVESSNQAAAAVNNVAKSFFTDSEVKQIAGNLSQGLSRILTGTSDESIGTVFKRAAQNYLAKQMEDTLNTIFTDVLSNVGTGGEGDILSSIAGFFAGSFHNGGVVPGRPGQEVPILAMAGETVIPAGQSPTGGGTTVVNNYSISAMDAQSFDQRWFESLNSNPKRVALANAAGKESVTGLRGR